MTDEPDLPQLTRPVLVTAFAGWNDAGSAATAALEHLELVWQARPVAAIDPEDYYDFQVNRPTVSLIDGQVRRLHWPTTRLSVATITGAGRDVVLVHGVEPNMRWRAFTDEILALAGELGVEMAVTLGALLLDTPHTRPAPVTGTASDDATAERLGLERSRYEGPTGIVGVLADAFATAGVPTVSFWAGVPHYAPDMSSVKGATALLRRVEDLLEVDVEMADLVEQARSEEKVIDELISDDSEVVEYVRQLEEREPETELPEASGEQIARDFERYLRGHGDDTP